MKDTIIAMRNPKSFTIEEEIEEYVSNTRGKGSASDRVNALLRRAILLERLETLDAEAASFFASTGNSRRSGTRAFQKASMRTLTRD